MPIEVHSLYLIWLYISEQCVRTVTTFKIPFIIMTLFFCVLLFIIACYFVLKWRRQPKTRNTKDETKHSTTDEKIPMNHTMDNNYEPTTA